MSLNDRRQSLRCPLDRPAKIRLEDSGRYRSAVVVNLSSGGALLRVEGPGRYLPGRRVRLGLEASRQPGVIRLDTMPEATVVRALSLDDAHHLGVRFEEAQEELFEAQTGQPATPPKTAKVA